MKKQCCLERKTTSTIRNNLPFNITKVLKRKESNDSNAGTLEDVLTVFNS